MPGQPGAHVDTTRRRGLLLTPVLVLASQYVALDFLTGVLGPRLGYFLAFMIYWFGWCLLFPVWAVGWQGMRAMFTPARPQFGRPTWLGLSILAVPLAVGYGVAFPRALSQATLEILIFPLALAALNATGKRSCGAAFISAYFRSDLVGGYLAFARIRRLAFCAAVVRANSMPGGAWSFVLVAGLFGLGWAWLTPAEWVDPVDHAGHILFDFAGLGALIYVGPNALALH